MTTSTENDTQVNPNVMAMAEKAYVNMEHDYAEKFVLAMASYKPDSATSQALREFVNQKKS